MAAKKEDPTAPVTPATYATDKVPQGKIAVTGDEKLLKRFLPATQFEITDNAAEKPKEGMDLLTWYMLQQSMENGNQFDPNNPDQDFAQNFEKLIKTLGLEDVQVNFDGKIVTMGELSKKLSSQNYEGGDFPAGNYPMGILSRTRLSADSPLSAKALANAEKLAQEKGVLGAIQTASKIVGVDATYMLLKAKQESGFNANAHAKTSSAGGLYQFLDSTWIATANKHKDLLEKYLHVDVDSLSKSQLLSLKTNAMASALMGAAFAKDNKEYLERKVDVPGGFHANSGALYMAHFLGPAGAEKFFENLAKNPSASAASLFPQAAASNASVFGGKTLADLGQWASNKVSGPAPVPA